MARSPQGNPVWAIQNKQANQDLMHTFTQETQKEKGSVWEVGREGGKGGGSAGHILTPCVGRWIKTWLTPPWFHDEL